ncbi:MAG: hypothetical protein EON54_23170 [Alcaligenaceae bacterium]|nr:MAG: hypothetical protein EON54_23170 [Alcaligenaceae bacterium]
MSKSAFRWLIVVSYVIPTVFAIGDLTFLSHLIPPEFKEAQAIYDAAQLEGDTTSTVLIGVLCIAAIAAVPFQLYGLLRFKQWGPRFAVWFSVACYMLIPFIGVTVQSGINFAAMSLGSMLWGIVVVLPYVSPQVRGYFCPNQEPAGN